MRLARPHPHPAASASPLGRVQGRLSGRVGLAVLGLMVGLVVVGPARAALPSADAVFFQEASECTAGFKARVVQHLKQAPSETRNQAILKDTEHGFVFIGVAYKKGLRNPEADQMLKAAEGRWSQLSTAQQASRLNRCTQQADQLMAEVSGLERFLVRNRAQARVDKLLAKEQRPAKP
ncbi:hypothetical protein WIT60_02335 [Aquabacterium sp. G14]|uniref:hypothetical protein n=1 Tax=Aquabacterium sp. G14 TaxID=3130164 RepID=UPI0030A83C83